MLTTKMEHFNYGSFNVFCQAKCWQWITSTSFWGEQSLPCTYHSKLVAKGMAILWVTSMRPLRSGNSKSKTKSFWNAAKFLGCLGPTNSTKESSLHWNFQHVFETETKKRVFNMTYIRWPTLNLTSLWLFTFHIVFNKRG